MNQARSSIFSGGIPSAIAILVLAAFALLVGTAQQARAELQINVTDGVVEQSNPAGEQFGYQRLEAVLSKSVEPHDLVEEVRNWAGTDSFDDDMTVVSIGFARR